MILMIMCKILMCNNINVCINGNINESNINV